MRVPLLVFVSWWCVTDVTAQFYAPETDFHDLCQRKFPVEAARVLAWLVREKQPGITEVTYSLATEGRDFVWNLEWRDAKGTSLREAVVHYQEASLTTGAEWFRNVWRQLEAEDWRTEPTTPDNGAAAFWKGAAGAGLSRMEGLTAALKQVALVPKMERGSHAAEVAGLLVQSAVPMRASIVSLDGAILSRAAAWLCIAEARGGKPIAAAWPTILALVGRENLAADLWRALPAADRGASPVQQFWDLLIRFPPATEALPAIVHGENRPYFLPLICAYADADSQYRPLLAEFGPAFAGKHWGRLHDYGGALNFATRNRDAIAGDFAGRSIAACLELLRTLPPQPGDFSKSAELASRVKDFEAGKYDPPAASAELVELLNAGIVEARGPLAPVAVVTARDVLGFCWELAGLQFGILHHHLSILLGRSPQAAAMAKGWMSPVNEWVSIFRANSAALEVEPPRDVLRAELINSAQAGARLIEAPPAAWLKDREAPSIYLRRRWLMDPHRGLEYLVRQNSAPERARELIRRSVREGGPIRNGHLLSRSNLLLSLRLPKSTWTFDEAVDELGLREELEKALPRNIDGRLSLLAREFGKSDTPLAYAQALERLHWECGVAFAPYDIFSLYLEANAREAAKRVYDRMHPAITNRSEFHRTLAAGRFALAVLEKDDAAIERVWRDSGGSTITRLIEVGRAFWRDDLTEAGRLIDQWIQAYPNGRGRPGYTRLREYLGLIPALANPAHADHGRALDEFPRTEAFLLLQWLLINKAGLSPDDAVRFLGGEQADSDRQVLIAAIRKDLTAFEAARREITPRRLDGVQSVLFACLHNDFANVGVPKEQPDLKPAATDLLPQMLRALVKGGAK